MLIFELSAYFVSKIALFRNLSVNTEVPHCGPRGEILWPVERIQNVASRMKYGGLGWQTYCLYLKKADLQNESSHVKFGEIYSIDLQTKKA